MPAANGFYSRSRKRESSNKNLDATLEKALSGLLLHSSKELPRTHLLSLPEEILRRIYRHLDSREALALSATCRRLHPWTIWAYRELRFILGRPETPVVLATTVESMQLLLDVLRSRPNYATSIRAIIICDPSPDRIFQVDDNEVPLATWKLLVESLDERIAKLVSVSVMLERFLWSDYAVCKFLTAQRTVRQLKHLRHLRELSLFRVCYPTSDHDLSTPRCSQALEHFSADCRAAEPYFCLPFLWGNGSLRSVHLKYVTEFQDPWWFQQLCAAGESWKNLQTLSVTCSEEGALTMDAFMRHCAVCNEVTFVLRSCLHRCLMSNRLSDRGVSSLLSPSFPYQDQCLLGSCTL